jgi:hypothetical protein
MLGDDVDLEGEPLAIVLGRGPARGHDARRAAAPPRPGAHFAASLRRLAASSPAVKRGRIGLRVRGRIGAAPAISTVARDRLRQSANSTAISARVLKRVLRRELPPVGFRDQASLGNADQRIMRLVIVGAREDTARWSRPAAGPTHRRDRSVRLRCGARSQAVTLQFDIEPVAEQLRKSVAGARRASCSAQPRAHWRAARTGPPVSAISPSRSPASQSILICGA